MFFVSRLYFNVICNIKTLNKIIRFPVSTFYTMKLSDDQMRHVIRPGVSKLADIFTRNGFEIRVAGGAVRDLLMGKIPTDLDFATTATPDEMKNMFEAEEVRMINFGGEKHGTITARIEEENFECTTLRIDRVTDGRHAEVEFIRDWEKDAGRRDLTINALFLALDGTIYDYYDGVKHLEKKLVDFVGDPDKRIQEDYLRILRYFRFYGVVSTSPDNHNPKIIASIKRNCEGLSKISGERIWTEFKKILSNKYGGEITAKMVECGIGAHIGLSIDFDGENLIKIYKKCKDAGINISEMNPCTLLAAGFTNEDDATVFIQRVRCSNKEKDTAIFIIKFRDSVLSAKSSKVISDLLVDLLYKDKRNKSHSLYLVGELVKYTCRLDLSDEVKSESIPIFPVKGGMLVDKVKNKREIQAKTKLLLDIWKDSNYTLNAEQLLDKL